MTSNALIFDNSQLTQSACTDRRCPAHVCNAASPSLVAVHTCHQLIADHLRLLSAVLHRASRGGSHYPEAISHENEAFQLLVMLAKAAEGIVEVIEESASRFSVSLSILSS
jgi:hypothetical protein